MGARMMLYGMLVIAWACGDSKCGDDSKCAGYVCTMKPLAQLVRPHGYMSTAEEVLVVAQGAWIAGGRRIEVQRSEGEPSFGEPSMAGDDELSADDYESCAAIRVPIVLVTHEDDDAGVPEREGLDLTVYGFSLAPEGSNPTTYDVQTYEGERAGFPIARTSRQSIYFAPDGTLWRMDSNFEPDQIGSRERR